MLPPRTHQGLQGELFILPHDRAKEPHGERAQHVGEELLEMSRVLGREELFGPHRHVAILKEAEEGGGAPIVMDLDHDAAMLQRHAQRGQERIVIGELGEQDVGVCRLGHGYEANQNVSPISSYSIWKSPVSMRKLSTARNVKRMRLKLALAEYVQ